MQQTQKDRKNVGLQVKMSLAQEIEAAARREDRSVSSFLREAARDRIAAQQSDQSLATT